MAEQETGKGEPLTFTVDQVAEKIGIGRNSCYEAIARGEIYAIRVGRRLLVPRAWLERKFSGDDA